MQLPSAHAALTRDLEQLRLVRGVGADEAVIFYAGRILEAETSAVLLDVDGEASGNAYGNLIRLGDLGLASSATLALFHALRMMTNAVRHVQRPVARDDADLAILLLRHFLGWRARPRGEARGETPGEAPEAQREDLDSFLRLLTQEPLDAPALSAWWSAHSASLLVSPVPVALCVERLAAAEGHASQAMTAVEQGLARFPRDRRLRQLQALLLRRAGRTPEAIAVLQALLREEREDPEALGLLAAIHKRAWRQAPDRDDLAHKELRRATDLYARGWEASRRTDTYVGINAASLLRARGERAASDAAVARILELYERRRGKPLPSAQPASARPASLRYTGYWDRATHAEATLLGGDVERARALFREARALHRAEAGSLQSSEEQLAWLLPLLDVTEPVRTFLEG